MKKRFIFLMAAVAAVASFGAIPNVDDGFESYAVGQMFVVATNGWQASGTAVSVATNGSYAGTKAAFMSETVALTNSLNTADPSLKVWSDFRIKPMLGLDLATLPTNTSSFLCYFNSNGIVVVATASGWQVCTNDIWGNPVAPANTNTYVRFSIFQDYTTSNQAVFLNDQLLLQDLRFVGSAGTYGKLVVQNTHNSCWLDNVWVKTNVIGLVSNRNNDAEALADADEVQRYGYARRTLYVNGGGTPSYNSIQDAVDALRPRDSIYVPAGTYAESLMILSNVAFEGQNFSADNLTIAEGASATFAQSVNCLGTLALTGQVAMAAGASLTSTTAHVIGSLSVSGTGSLVVTNLDVGAAGLVSFNNAQLVANAAGVVMNGTFAISNTWGSATLVSMPLPFSDNFELYGAGTMITNLKFRGWNASTGMVFVTNGVAQSGVKSVVLPDGTVLTNSINSAATLIWTDTYLRPALGALPTAPETNASSFLAYADANGFLVVATAGGWVVCSNKIDHTQATLLQSNAFSRITICQDLRPGFRKFAVFVAGYLVAQGLIPPANNLVYTSFGADNRNGTAYVDDVLITTAIPSGLTADLDLDGTPDAYEINNFGLTTQPSGSIYTFR